MATYPDLPTARGSDPKPITKLEIDRAEDGTARARSYHAGDKVQIEVEHPYLTGVEKSALDAFYAANRLLAFDYESPSDGVTRSMLFASAPIYRNEPGNRYTATVEMEQV